LDGGTLHVSASAQAKSGWVMICHTCERGEHWMRELARAAGAPDTWGFMCDPASYLVPVDGAGRSGRRGTESSDDWPPFPTSARVDGFAGRLWTQDPGATRARRWLVEERGISEAEIKRWRIGWNGGGLVFPLYEGDVASAGRRLVNIKLRRPVNGAQMLAWKGVRSFPLFALDDARSIVLCEGELDALAVRSVGIPACSVTAGKAAWRDGWTVALRGRRVAVCYDVDAEQDGKAAVRRLRRSSGPTAAGLVKLPLSVDKGDKDVSDFLRKHGVEELLKLIRAVTLM
jgi:DNA primase